MNASEDRDPADQHRAHAIMSVVAALCVLGFASLFWLRGYDGMSATANAASAASDARPMTNDFAGSPSTTGVPSAEGVFRGANDIAPEEPIAQF